MIKLTDILNEAKQVGKLYHFTSLENLESIKKHGLKFNKDNLSFFNPKYRHVLYSISTTRNKSEDIAAGWGKAQIRITLDGDKISNKYKILPVNASNIWRPGTTSSSKEEGWAEERIISKTPGFLSTEYILDVEELDTFFDFDESYTFQEGVHDPVKPGILKKRLGKLSCSRVRSAKSKLKNKGTHYAKALQRYLNYHC
jgi:hypothetical protein